MGLLDKAIAFSGQGSLLIQASRVQDDSETSAEDADAVSKENQKKKIGSGWLDLHDIIEDETAKEKGYPDSEELKQFNSSEVLSSLLSCIHDTKADLQAPAELFNIISDVFHIEKGSLLLLNHRDKHFIGWAHRGYDKTTKNRLRLPYDISEKLFPEKSCDPVFLESDDIEFFRPYFSIREFSLLERIYLLPFIYHDQVIGIFIVTSSPILLESDKAFFEPFKNVFTTISKIIYHSREEKLNKLSRTEVKPKDLILQQITALTEQARHEGTQIYFIIFNFRELLEIIRNELENIDIYRIQEDILQVITSMMPENDKIYFVNTHKLLVILPGRYHINEKLFIHQISVALRQMYSSLQNFNLNTYEIIVYPDDASRPDEVIKLIFQ